MKHIVKLLAFSLATGLILASCEGPRGLAGEDGLDGNDGKDANESCIQCHNSDVVQKTSIEFSHSVHHQGEAFIRGTSATCAPCHSHQGFLDVVGKNTPATFTGTTNNYVASASVLSLPGEISCFTCHSSLHSTYTEDDFFPLTTTAAVPLTMWGGTKTINFAKSTGNLCSKCHQPRPVTGSTGVIDYAALVSDPTATYNMSSIAYRTGVHYGTQSSMAAGVGGVEFGTGYTNSAHTTLASCNSCHMATPAGLAGGHSFNAAGNFAGCNVSGCHTNMSATNALYTTAVDDVASLLADLAAAINAVGGGHDILLQDADGTYHGYFDVFYSANPTGYWRNPEFGTPELPALTNAQFGAIINLQMVARGAGKGVHNYPYIKKLLENSIAAIAPI